MQLNFTKQFPWGEPTYFVEKIINSLHGLSCFDFFPLSKLYDHNLDMIEECKPKKHTIRFDTKNRWKAGNNIHFVINNRTKNRFHFAPLIPCVSTQHIKIQWEGSHKHKKLGASVFVDGKFLYMPQIKILAQNDGFDSVADFFRWFNKDFEGKIIHWTDLKY